MKFIKYLILSSCFCISTAWAGMNNEGAFVELTSDVFVTPFSGVLTIGGGAGYKYNSSNENYFGYFQGDINLDVLALDIGGRSGEIGHIRGIFNFEYGYEFNRESSFSYGVSLSPIVPVIYYGSKLQTKKLIVNFVSFIRIFGNIKINDSFLISIVGQGTLLGWEYFIERTILKKERSSLALHPLFPIPSIAVKGKYFF